MTTVYLDIDHVIDQVRWQYAGLVQDRLDAQEFADTIYTEHAQIIRLGEDRAGTLMPWLDELVALSIENRFAENFYRMQALWFSVAHVIAPFIKVTPARISPSQRAHIRPTLPRSRRFAPSRAEARLAAELLQVGHHPSESHQGHCLPLTPRRRCLIASGHAGTTRAQPLFECRVLC